MFTLSLKLQNIKSSYQSIYYQSILFSDSRWRLDILVEIAERGAPQLTTYRYHNLSQMIPIHLFWFDVLFEAVGNHNENALRCTNNRSYHSNLYSCPRYSRVRKTNQHYENNIKQIKGKALRKHSLNEKTAASVLLKLFISSNDWCHTTDAL